MVGLSQSFEVGIVVVMTGMVVYVQECVIQILK